MVNCFLRIFQKRKRPKTLVSNNVKNKYSLATQAEAKQFHDFITLQNKNENENDRQYFKQLSQPIVYIMADDENNMPQDDVYEKANIKNAVIITTFGKKDVRTINQFYFDPFTWESSHNHKGILCLCETIFEYEGLFKIEGIDKHKCLCFFDKIDNEYTQLTNQFHNKYHILFTLQAMFVLVQRIRIFTPFEKIALYISALIHDMGHPGFTNYHIILEHNKWATLYNDNSPLENMHIYKFFELILSNPKYNFLSKLSPESYLRLRHMIIKNVLATDMEKHFDILKTFKDTYLYNENVDVLSVDTSCDLVNQQVHILHHSMEKKVILMQVMMKCADFSHLWAYRDMFLIMTNGLEDELFAQGDVERKLWGKVFSPMSDRNNPDYALLKNQLSFFEVMVFPLFLGMSLVCPHTIDILNRSKDNYHYMKILLSRMR